jgi:hypothetical protein
MVTKARKWPQNCEYARLDSIALAEQGWRMLDVLLDELDNVRHVRQVGRVMNNLKEICFKLTVCKDGQSLTTLKDGENNRTKELIP